MMKESLTTAIGNISNLPPMPVTAHRILQMLTDPTVSNKDLAQAVMYDPTLAAKALQMANSAYYGLPNRVTGIANAIAVLGRATLHTVILTIACSELYRKTSTNNYLSKQDLWRHALGVGMLARHLVKRVPGGLFMEEAFVAGLLHDIGKIVLDICCPEEYARTCRVAQERGIPLYEVERTLGPALHTEAGELLAQTWKLPVPIAQAIRWHHEPDKASGATLPLVIHAANEIAEYSRRPVGSAGDGPTIHPKAEQLLHLDPESIKFLLDMLKLEMQAADAFLSLGGTSKL